MRWALDHGHRSFLEPGPGTILAGILRKIDPEARVRPAATPADGIFRDPVASDGGS